MVKRKWAFLFDWVASVLKLVYNFEDVTVRSTSFTALLKLILLYLRKLGAEPSALENFVFFCKNKLILDLFW